MKVDPTRSIAREAVTGPDRSKAEAGRTERTAAERPDALRLSGDLELATRVITAAGTDDDRSAAVAEARARYERGELGVDTDRLADSMIDALIHSHDDHT